MLIRSWRHWKSVVGPVDDIEDQERKRKHDSACFLDRFSRRLHKVVEVAFDSIDAFTLVRIRLSCKAGSIARWAALITEHGHSSTNYLWFTGAYVFLQLLHDPKQKHYSNRNPSDDLSAVGNPIDQAVIRLLTKHNELLRGNSNN